MTQAEQLLAIKAFVAHMFEHEQTGHDLPHLQRVVLLAQKILLTEPTADQFIVEASAWLHDTYDDKLVANQLIAKQRVGAFLTTIKVPLAQQKVIFAIIDNMSWSKMLTQQAKSLDINGKIVQDADRLDAIGAIGIARTIMYGVKHNTPLYDQTIRPRQEMDKQTYRQTTNTTIINHFDEKLLKIKDHLNTQYAQQVGQARHQVMLTYLAAFKQEWQLAELE